MVAQKLKKKKKCWQNFFAFLSVYQPKTRLIKILNSLDFSRPNVRLLENQKTGDYRELFLPENDLRNCSTQKNSKKNIHILEAWKPAKDMKFRLEFSCTCPSTYELNIIQKLFWALN